MIYDLGRRRWETGRLRIPNSQLHLFLLSVSPEHEITQINDDKMINDAAKMFSGNSKTSNDKKVRGRHL